MARKGKYTHPKRKQRNKGGQLKPPNLAQRRNPVKGVKRAGLGKV